MEIRFKDGMPLMTAGGQVAGSQSCCCENPPPPMCWCPDYCQYKIEIVSPQECRASSRYGCEGSGTTAFTEPSLIQSVLDPFDGVIDCPGETSGAGGAPCGNYGQAFMSNAFMESVGLYANAYSAIAKRREVGFFAGVIADVGFQARVFCLMPSTTGAAKPQIFLQLDLQARVQNTDSLLGEMFFYYRFARKTVRIENENCEAAGDRKCLYLNDTNRRIANFQTPLEFTLSFATTSFGDYDEDGLSNREFGPYQDVLNSLINTAPDATFRITSRPNCLPVVECDCESITNGLTISIYKAPFAPQTFVWNEEEQFASYTDLSSFYSISYGPSGSGNGAVIVMQQWNLSVTELQFEWTVRIFCEAVPSGIPSPYRWYVSTAVECFEWDGGTVTKRTKKTYMGWFGCEADPCGTNGREKGDLYPSGGVNDLELVSTVTPEGYEPCALPTPIFTIFLNNYAECPE